MDDTFPAIYIDEFDIVIHEVSYKTLFDDGYDNVYISQKDQNPTYTVWRRMAYPLKPEDIHSENLPQNKIASYITGTKIFGDDVYILPDDIKDFKLLFKKVHKLYLEIQNE